MRRSKMFAVRRSSAAVGLLLSILLFGCRDSGTKPKNLAPVEVLIDWQAEPTYLGIYYAKHRGYFEQAGFAVTVAQSRGANQAVAAVSSGKNIIGTASGGATVLGRNNGANVVSLGVMYPHISSVVYGLAATGVTKPADLKGKRVGIYPGSITSNEFDAFLKLTGLRRSDMEIVSLNGPDIPLLLSRQVDAVLHYGEMSPAQAEASAQVPGTSGRKTFQLKLADYGVGGYGLNIIANPAAWREDPARLRRLRDAILRGYGDGCVQRQAAIDAFLAEFPDKDRNYVRMSWDRVCDLVGRNAGAQDRAGWQSTIDLYRGLGLLRADIGPADVMVN
jgi:ABC-type nitrate/sulfonate/bicarbonate transport system substrate-binding protein